MLTEKSILTILPASRLAPSVVDPTRAPVDYHTVKIESNLPYDLKEASKHWDEIKDQVADSLLNHLRRLTCVGLSHTRF
jgi:phytoene dehydrogenase-like protein